MKIEAMLVGTLMFFTGAAFAQVQPVADAAVQATLAAKASKKADGVDKVRCERMPVTGSRVGKRVCHTEGEWAMIEQRAGELMRDIGSTPVAAPDMSSATGRRGVSGALGGG